MGEVGRARSKTGEFPALRHKCTPQRSGASTRPELELSGARHGAELDAATMAAVLARVPRPELERSDARTTGPSWSGPTCAPLGPSWSGPTRAPRGRAGAVRRARHRAERNWSPCPRKGANVGTPASQTLGCDAASNHRACQRNDWDPPRQRWDSGSDAHQQGRVNPILRPQMPCGVQRPRRQCGRARGRWGQRLPLQRCKHCRPC